MLNASARVSVHATEEVDHPRRVSVHVARVVFHLVKWGLTCGTDVRPTGASRRPCIVSRYMTLTDVRQYHSGSGTSRKGERTSSNAKR